MNNNKQIKMYDPTIDYNNHREEYNEAIQQVLNHGRFILGPEVFELEKNLSNFCGAKHSITVDNGTVALMIALMALDVKPNDYFITTTFSWISSAEIGCILGAKPIFVDIDPDTYNISPKALEAAILKCSDEVRCRIKAIIAVSIFGQMADFTEILRIGNKYNIDVIEDAAQSFGACIYTGASFRIDENSRVSDSAENGIKMSTNICRISTTSFFPSKPLGCFGDGGCIFTNDDDLALKIRAIRTHGGLERFKHNYVGTNARINTIMAAVLNVKLKYFEKSLEARIRNAAIYNELLGGKYKTPFVAHGNRHVYAQYTLLMDSEEERNELIARLKDHGVETGIFYPICLHTQKAFDGFRDREYKEGDFPVAENICKRVVSIPCYSDLDEDTIRYIASIIYF